MLIHTQGSLTCEVCQKVVTNSNALRVHMKSHTTDKNFPCLRCPQKFASQQLLDIHEVMHNTIQPFQCDQCNCGYNFEADLTRHIIRMHSIPNI